MNRSVANSFLSFLSFPREAWERGNSSGQALTYRLTLADDDMPSAAKHIKPRT